MHATSCLALLLNSVLFTVAATEALSIQIAPPTIDCSLVLCALPECDEDEISRTLPGQCCPTCVPSPGSYACKLANINFVHDTEARRSNL